MPARRPRIRPARRAIAEAVGGWAAELANPALGYWRRTSLIDPKTGRLAKPACAPRKRVSRKEWEAEERRRVRKLVGYALEEIARQVNEIRRLVGESDAGA